jgi:hypothetical protein
MHRTVILDTADPGRSPQATIDELMAELRRQLEAEGVAAERRAREAAAARRGQVAALWERCLGQGRALRRLLRPLHGLALAGGHSLKVIESGSRAPKSLETYNAWLVFKLRICGPDKRNLPVVGMPTDVYVLFNRDPPYCTGRPGHTERLRSPEDVLALVVAWVRRRNAELETELGRRLEAEVL